jgi:uncharacterized protein
MRAIDGVDRAPIPTPDWLRSDERHVHDNVGVSVTLPLVLRNWLAELILAALHDGEARRALEVVANASAPGGDGTSGADVLRGAGGNLFEERAGGVALRAEWVGHAAEMRERARRAWRAIDARPLDPAEPSLASAMPAAALLFDAGLYFEVHELLEPQWLRAEGRGREMLQGLIQIAVGFQHLANGNVTGARALLADGSAKTEGRRLEDLDLSAFTRAVRGCLAQIVARGDAAARAFDWAAVPRFPRS